MIFGSYCWVSFKSSPRGPNVQQGWEPLWTKRQVTGQKDSTFPFSSFSWSPAQSEPQSWGRPLLDRRFSFQLLWCCPISHSLSAPLMGGSVCFRASLVFPQCPSGLVNFVLHFNIPPICVLQVSWGHVIACCILRKEFWLLQGQVLDWSDPLGVMNQMLWMRSLWGLWSQES